LDDEGAGPAGYGPPLTRALGIRPVVTVDAFSVDVMAGDRILLCSDGLTRHIPGDEWLVTQLEGNALDAIAEELISHANEAGGQDNISVVLVTLESSVTDPPPPSQRVRQQSGRLHALGGVFLFRELPIGLLSRIITHCEIRRVTDGETLFEDGERCDRLFVVAEGRLRLVDDGTVVGELDAGAHTGSTTLLHPRPARASLVSDGPSTVITLGSERFWWLVKARPWLGVNLLERLVEELGRELESSIARRDDGVDATSVLDPSERL
ncbi:MAG: cyclic nucleotide-binding domain-containing protein, partial [Polyangiaceae bacterium]